MGAAGTGKHPAASSHGILSPLGGHSLKEAAGRLRRAISILGSRGASINKGKMNHMSSTSAQLDQARNDLAAIEVELNALHAAKAEASKTPSAFSKWRAAYDAATAERERLVTVVESLEPAAAAEESASARDDLLKRYEAKATANAKLASRIKSDVAKANAILLALARDVAQSAAEDAEINAGLPDDIEPLTPADFAARGRPGLDRKELKKTRVMLWVNARTGGLIGDQDSVRDRGDGLGQIGEGPYTVNCQRSPFVQTEYHPTEPAQRPEALWQMRLPSPDGPGWAFDGTRCNYPEAVLAELERGAARAEEPRERQTEIELRPVPPVKEVAA
jgi:hypothetical protein